MTVTGRYGQPGQVAGDRPQAVELAVKGDFSARDHQDALGHLLQIVHVMAGHHDGHAVFPVDRLEKVDHLPLGHHVKAQRRLIKQYQLRAVQQHHGQIRPHALPQAQFSGKGAEDRPQIQQIAHHAEVAPVHFIRYVPYHLFPFKALDDGVIPPKLRPVAKQHADPAHQGDPLMLRRQG